MDRRGCVRRGLGGTPSLIPYRGDSWRRRSVETDDLADALRQGEQIEFKEYIKLGDKKETELVNVIVAFANTKGGTIYVGVDDVCDLRREQDCVQSDS